MNFSVIVLLIVLGLTGFVLQLTSKLKLKEVYSYLFFISLALMAYSHIDQGQIIVAGSIVLVSVNIIVSRIKFLEKKWYSALVVLGSTLALLLLHRNDLIELNSEINLFANKFSIGGLALMALLPIFSIVKLKSINTLFKLEESIELPINVFFTGMAVFLLSLGLGRFGLYMGGVVLLSGSFYFKKSLLDISLALLMLSGVTLLGGSDTAIDLFAGEILFGLFVGVFVITIAGKLKQEPKHAVLLVISALIVIVMAMLLLYGGDMFHLMGGVDAVLAIVIGMALTNVLYPSKYIASAISGLLFALVLGLQTIAISNERQRVVPEDVNEEQVLEKLSVEYLSVEENTGEFKIVSDSSRIDFSLGAQNETKGAFKKVSGEVELKTELDGSKMLVELSMDDFTTFNSFRDKSLRGDEYFQIEKFPEMSFQVDQIVKTDDKVYLAKGQFTMLGKTLPQVTTLRLIKSTSGKRLIGSGEINRVEFGMTPSSSEGNVVSFEYNVLLSDQK